jgi:hypothetical protein
MSKKKSWKFSEEKILIDNYNTKTISELKELLPGRDADSINSKVKRLKVAGKIVGVKADETRKRAYIQRTKRIN